MRLVTAVIQPAKLNAVRDVLASLDVTGMTVTDVKGFGRQKGKTETYRGASVGVEWVLKSRVEIVVPDNRVDPVVEAIRDAAFSGKVGDGKIFVSSIEEVMRIRTAETGEDAV